MEFFDSVNEIPERQEAVEVMMVDVNCEQPVACVGQGHIEERNGRLPEVDGGP